MRKFDSPHALPAAVDLLIAFSLAVGAVAWANQRSVPTGGYAEFFMLRITLMNVAFSAVFAVAWKQCLVVLGLYRRDMAGLYGLMVRTAGVSVVMTTLLAIYLDGSHPGGPLGKTLTWFFVVGFLYQICRLLVCSPQLRWHVVEPERVIVLGSGPRASKAWRELRVHCHESKQLLGFVDDRDPSAMAPDIASRLIGRVEDLSEYLLQNAIDELIVATPMRSCYDITQRAVSIAEAAGVRVVFLNDVYTLSHEKSLRQRATLFLELVPKDDRREAAETAKRILDVLGAGLGLAVLAPLFLMVAVAIKLTSQGPAFFMQERYGYRRRRFRMYKFRSMVHNASELMGELESLNEAQGPIFKMKNDPRVTALGRFLRRTSIDELPQLWNVLLGDMSLVGPRPMSVRDVSLFSETQLMRRFSVRPGMTGIWQVAGRSSLSFDQWVELDFSYIDRWSLLLDLQILARTVPAVLRRSGAV